MFKWYINQSWRICVAWGTIEKSLMMKELWNCNLPHWHKERTSSSTWDFLMLIARKVTTNWLFFFLSIVCLSILFFFFTVHSYLFWVGGFWRFGIMWWGKCDGGACVKLLLICVILPWTLLLFILIFMVLGWWGFATLVVSPSGEIEMKHDKLIWFHEVS